MTRTYNSWIKYSISNASMIYLIVDQLLKLNDPFDSGPLEDIWKHSLLHITFINLLEMWMNEKLSSTWYSPLVFNSSSNNFIFGFYQSKLYSGLFLFAVFFFKIWLGLRGVEMPIQMMQWLFLNLVFFSELLYCFLCEGGLSESIF